jgi:hypothetical protein
MDFNTSNAVMVAEFNDLNDTIYTDQGMNTLDNTWTYRIELINNTPGNVFSVGFSVPASSILLIQHPPTGRITLTINENVPWANERYEIYRRTANSNIFDSIAMVQVRRYVDTGLVKWHSIVIMFAQLEPTVHLDILTL